MSLTSRVLARADLTRADVGTMYALFEQSFRGTSRAQFERDLANKDWVILLEDGEARVRGFTTIALYASCFGGAALGVVCSGDTIVHPEFRSTLALPRAWIRTVLDRADTLPRPLYWLLISSGVRTYRFLPVFYREFYPRHDRATPADIQTLMDHLARERYGEDYHADCGIVRFREGATPLRAGVDEIGDGRHGDPHVAFFARRNPGHGRGDELVCLTRIEAENLTAAGRRMLR